MALPAGVRVSEVVVDGKRMVLLGEDEGGQQFIAVVDAESGARRNLIRLILRNEAKGRAVDKATQKTDPNIGKTIGVTIDEIGSNGDGIGRFEGAPIYVPLALPGDALSVRLCDRRGQGYAAELVEGRTLMPRHQPICRHFGTCGGCRLQHLRPFDYRAWKRQQVQTALASRGIDDVEIKPLIDGHPASRRRLRLAFRPDGGRLALGLRRRLGSDIVAVQDCPITLPAIVNLLTPLRNDLGPLDLAVKGGEFSITAANNGLDVLIETNVEPSLADREGLAALAKLRIWQGLPGGRMPALHPSRSQPAASPLSISVASPWPCPQEPFCRRPRRLRAP